MKIILVLLCLIIRLIASPQAVPISTTEADLSEFSIQLNSIRKGRFVEINQTTLIENIDMDDANIVQEETTSTEKFKAANKFSLEENDITAASKSDYNIEATISSFVSSSKHHRQPDYEYSNRIFNENQVRADSILISQENGKIYRNENEIFSNEEYRYDSSCSENNLPHNLVEESQHIWANNDCEEINVPEQILNEQLSFPIENCCQEFVPEIDINLLHIPENINSSPNLIDEAMCTEFYENSVYEEPDDKNKGCLYDDCMCGEMIRNVEQNVCEIDACNIDTSIALCSNV